LEIKNFDPIFSNPSKKFGKKVKPYVKNPSFFLKKIKRTTLKTIALIKLILPKMI
jgi:hypothetical protein